MSTGAHVFTTTIYYEDTDLSGFVYHPNYLKYFERAREHFFGVQALATMMRDTGIGWVVYRCEMTFKSPARHADTLHIHSTPRVESDYRVVFHQEVRRDDRAQPLVHGVVELVCVDANGALVRVPAEVMADLEAKLRALEDVGGTAP